MWYANWCIILLRDHKNFEPEVDSGESASWIKNKEVSDLCYTRLDHWSKLDSHNWIFYYWPNTLEMAVWCIYFWAPSLFQVFHWLVPCRLCTSILAVVEALINMLEFLLFRNCFWLGQVFYLMSIYYHQPCFFDLTESKCNWRKTKAECKTGRTNLVQSMKLKQEAKL